MEQFIELVLGPAGALVLLLFALVGGWRQWYVFAWRYNEVKQERDEWKTIAFRALGISEKAADTAQHAAQIVKDGLVK